MGIPRFCVRSLISLIAPVYTQQLLLAQQRLLWKTARTKGGFGFTMHFKCPLSFTTASKPPKSWIQRSYKRTLRGISGWVDMQRPRCLWHSSSKISIGDTISTTRRHPDAIAAKCAPSSGWIAASNLATYVDVDYDPRSRSGHIPGGLGSLRYGNQQHSKAAVSAV